MSNPKISLNKLAEYIVANVARRGSIVREQMNPKPFVVRRYMEERAEAIGYLATGSGEPDRQLSSGAAEAVDSISSVLNNMSLTDVALVPVEHAFSANMEFSGVRVSVRPDLILVDLASGKNIGAIKLHFPKTYPLGEKSLECAALILHRYMGQQNPGVVIDRKMCYAIDVSTQSFACAPKAQVRAIREVESACEEFRGRWELIKVAA